MMNLVRRIVETKVKPLIGDRIKDLKESVKEYAIRYECRVLFEHNDKQFICDKNGNIAQIN